MKTKIFITVGYLVIAIFAFGQNKQSTKAKILSAKVENSIQSKRYEISVNYVNPMTGKPRNLTPDYSIQISDDSTYVYLPYFGRAYSAPMNGEGGIRIANLMNNYKVDNNKGKNYSIGFTAKGTDDTYRFSITVWTNGRASVLVTCNNRQAISYNGNLILPDN